MGEGCVLRTGSKCVFSRQWDHMNGVNNNIALASGVDLIIS